MPTGAGVLDSIPYLVIGVVIGAVFAWLYHELWKLRYTRHVRQDAVQRSLAVTAGKVHEQLAPYLPDFDFNPKDARFLGSPVDFVVFDGLDDGGECRVVFVEVKTAGSTLSTRERRVREAVREGRVEWAELRLSPPAAGLKKGRTAPAR
jgi:predicted Holliday junction resolvase-like endonuclease